MSSDIFHLRGTGPTFFAISLVIASIGLILFMARTYTSWRCTKRFRLDYWLSLLTFLLLSFSETFACLGFLYGIGAHIESLEPGQVVSAMHTVWVSMISGLIAIVIGKLSLIAFLDQIRGHQHRRPWFLWFIGITNIAVHITVIVLILTQCNPHAKLWDASLPGHCNGRMLNKRYAYFQGSYSAVSDAALAIYPIYLIWGLQLSPRMKLGLCGLLGFGLLAAICSAIKTAQLTNLTHTDDMTYYIARVSITTITEAYVILIVGCIPTLRPLMKTITGKYRNTSSRSHARSSPFSGPTLRYGHDKFSVLSSATRNDQSPHGTASSTSKKILDLARNPKLVADHNIHGIGNRTRAYHEIQSPSFHHNRHVQAELYEMSRQGVAGGTGRKSSESKGSQMKDPEQSIVMTTDIQVRYEGNDIDMSGK